jgi:dTMP kinase
MKKSKNIFIVFEGLSGSGKTTIAKKIAKMIGGIYYKTPPYPFSTIRNKIDKYCDYDSRFLFYLSSVNYASKNIEKLLESKPVVCDRYILTTICFHKVLGVNVNNIKLSIIKPDFTFLITCKENERRKRIIYRGLTYNDKMEIKLKTDKFFLSEYRKYNLLEIDNSYSIDKTIKKIFDIINQNIKN